MHTFELNHTALAVKDVNESISFYQKIFHLKEIKNTASDSKTRWLSFSDGRQLHLIPRPNAEIIIVKAVHFALATKDINSFIQSLDKEKIHYSDWKDSPEKNYIRNDGIKQVYFQDPDGYWIEVNNDV